MASQHDIRQTTCRVGESDAPVTFRSNRFFTCGSKWFFSTREGIDHGPFPSRIVAHNAIQKFIRERISSVLSA